MLCKTALFWTPDLSGRASWRVCGSEYYIYISGHESNLHKLSYWGQIAMEAWELIPDHYFFGSEQDCWSNLVPRWKGLETSLIIIPRPSRLGSDKTGGLVPRPLSKMVWAHEIKTHCIMACSNNRLYIAQPFMYPIKQTKGILVYYI